MPHKYPDKFRSRAIALVRSGQTAVKTASELGIAQACLYGWVEQDRIDRGDVPGVSTTESRGLRSAKRRICELEEEVEILPRASEMLGRPTQHPKGSTR